MADDPAHAAALFQRACDGDNPLGCTSLGVLYASGHGVTLDLTRAAALFKRGCDAGYAGGCEALDRLKAK